MLSRGIRTEHQSALTRLDTVPLGSGLSEYIKTSREALRVGQVTRAAQGQSTATGSRRGRDILAVGYRESRFLNRARSVY